MYFFVFCQFFIIFSPHFAIVSAAFRTLFSHVFTDVFTGKSDCRTLSQVYLWGVFEPFCVCFLCVLQTSFVTDCGSTEPPIY